MSSFGRIFRTTTFGESHGQVVGVVVDGVPSLIELDKSDIQAQLDRRRPGQSDVTTPRNEADQVSILSGVQNGMTLGTPIALVVSNLEVKREDYQNILTVPRPSHADYTYWMKYGIQSYSGGGRASARETIGRVAAGAIADKWLRKTFGVEIVAWVSSIGDIELEKSVSALLDEKITREDVDKTVTRCPDVEVSNRMAELVSKIKEEDDSIGGVITCFCRNVPPGWGEPCFDKLEAMLAYAMLSIPATKGFEIGSGFAGSKMRGSHHNDTFVKKNKKLGTTTNNSGGIQGGISNGEDIIFRVAFKPAATIRKPQITSDFDGHTVILEVKGRHDPCIVPRAVPIVESMAALVLADAAMLQAARCYKA
ncbi:chorismate synthase-like [Schistocerca gregaria]|uniref:chorismate synthase-like n=1 Tax=Schistocerca gregaria TaxID=7010 RepID=UPI00211DB08D|nr:chorismate synthase-like [Schistocerca gregaria]